MLSVFAALERDMIQERVLSGMANARAKRRFTGFKRQQLDLVSVRDRVAAGESMRGVAKTLAISPALLSQRLREPDADDDDDDEHDGD
jgi:DNA invertase Pin-like site-specific DNA recombinase